MRNLRKEGGYVPNNKEVKEFYRRKIIELIRECDSERWLRAIYTFVKNLLS